MKKIALALFAVTCLTVPAVAGPSVVTDKPMVVAEGVEIGVGGVRVGDRDHDRDVRRHHRDRDVIVVKPRHHDHGGERAHD
jgi:hypothetical protein